jgi:hypothetical protein
VTWRGGASASAASASDSKEGKFFAAARGGVGGGVTSVSLSAQEQ